MQKETRAFLLVSVVLVFVPSIRAIANKMVPLNHKQSSPVVGDLNEFEKLAIKRVTGETPKILRGVWLETPIYRVKVKVDEQGNVTEVSPLYGNSLLAEAALDAARKWKFQPYKKDGKPVSVIGAINIVFPNDRPQRDEQLKIALQELQLPSPYPFHYFNAGLVHRLDSHYKESIGYYQKAIERDPNWVVAYFGMGEAYKGMDQTSDAIKYFQRAVEIKPDYFEAYKQIGLCLVRLHRSWGKEAEKVFLQAASVAKSLDEKIGINRNLVSCYKEQGRQEEEAVAQMEVARFAAEYYSVFQGVTIDVAEEAFLAGTKYERAGKMEKAITAYRLAMEIKPQSEAGLLSRLIVAGYLRKQNQPGEATKLLEEMIGLSNEAIQASEATRSAYYLSNAFFWRGCARDEMGQTQLALADLKESVKYNPDWGQPHLRLGYIYQKAGDLKSAVREFRASKMVDETFIRQVESQGKPPR